MTVAAMADALDVDESVLTTPGEPAEPERPARMAPRAGSPTSDSDEHTGSAG